MWCDFCGPGADSDRDPQSPAVQEGKSPVEELKKSADDLLAKCGMVKDEKPCSIRIERPLRQAPTS
jgi:hypothetical protein